MYKSLPKKLCLLLLFSPISMIAQVKYSTSQQECDKRKQQAFALYLGILRIFETQKLIICILQQNSY